jgi:hypothetical protein
MSGSVVLDWLNLASYGSSMVLLQMTNNYITDKIFLITYGYR